MTSQAKQGLSDWDSDKYWTAQDFDTSARLHLQHWIWNHQLGYALHPALQLPHPKQPLRIADVAAGNAAWILEVNRANPSANITFDGFDITSTNFPHPAWLPSNIHLHVWDAFSPLPDEYIGVFDIVHIRTFYSIVLDNKVDSLLTNLLAMLKPGGYLQWDENDASTLTCRAPSNLNEEVKADATQALVKMQALFSAQTKMSPLWLHQLPATLRERGCAVVADEKSASRPDLAKAWTENMLLVWRSLVAYLPETEFPLPPGMGLPEKMSRKRYAELFEEVVAETSRGVAVGMDMQVILARKGE